HRRGSVDGDFGDAVPLAELGRATPLAVADDADVAARDGGKIVALGLERLPAAPAGEGRGPGGVVERHLDLEDGGPRRSLVPRHGDGPDGHRHAEVVSDLLAIALGRPASGGVVVAGALGDVGVLIGASGALDQSERVYIRSIGN